MLKAYNNHFGSRSQIKIPKIWSFCNLNSVKINRKYENLNILHIFSALWAKNVQSPSWWQLGMYFTPYDLPKKNLKPSLLRGGRFPTPWAPGLNR